MTPHPTPLLSFWTLGYYWGELILSQHRLCGRGGGEGEGPLLTNELGKPQTNLMSGYIFEKIHEHCIF